MQFCVLYSGTDPRDARLIGITRSPKVLRSVAAAALREIRPSSDPITERLEAGRREALEQILRDGSTR
jgi:hypothetical protein